MARKHRRHYRGLQTISFGKLMPTVPTSVSTKGVATGAAIGVLAMLFGRYAWRKWAPASWNTADRTKTVLYFVNDNLPGLSAILAGAVAYFVQKKRGRAGGGDILVGAGLVGAGQIVLPIAQRALGPSFMGLTTLNFGRLGGITVAIPEAARYGGVIVPTQPQLGTGGAVQSYVAARTMANRAQLGALQTARARR